MKTKYLKGNEFIIKIDNKDTYGTDMNNKILIYYKWINTPFGIITMYFNREGSVERYTYGGELLSYDSSKEESRKNLRYERVL